MLEWLGVEVSHVAVWEWINKLGDKLAGCGWKPANKLPEEIVLMDETVVKQRGESFTLFAALNPSNRNVVHIDVFPTRNYYTTRKFLKEIEELYGELPHTIVTDGAVGYGGAFDQLRINHVILKHDIRNRIERWFQELKRRINTFYASFNGKNVETTQNWLRQFIWFWNYCLS